MSEPVHPHKVTDLEVTQTYKRMAEKVRNLLRNLKRRKLSLIHVSELLNTTSVHDLSQREEAKRGEFPQIQGAVFPMLSWHEITSHIGVI